MTNELLLNVFIEDLSEVNKGNMCGRWYDLTKAEELTAAIEFINSVEEHVITDVDSEVFFIDEYDGIDELTEVADVYPEVSKAVKDYGIDAVKEVLSWIDLIDGASYINQLERLFAVDYDVKGFEHAIGGYFFDNIVNSHGVDKDLIMYFDYESYGRDMLITEDVTYLNEYDGKYIFIDESDRYNEY